MNRKIAFTRRDFLRWSAASAFVACAGRPAPLRASGALFPLPRVSGGLNVAPLRRLEPNAGLTPPLIEPKLVDLQLQVVYELGFEWIRIPISFNRFGPDFLGAIPYVRAARALGIHVLGIIDQFSGFDLVNALSRRSTREEVLKVYLEIFDSPVAPATSAIPASGSFAAQVLNEPTNFLGIHPVDYVREFLAPSYDRLKEEDPNLVVISAAEVGGVDGVLRMRAMFEAGLERYCDRVAFHVYDEKIISRLSGMARKGVWITESGVRGTERHLDWVTRVFEEISSGISGVEHIFYFILCDLDPGRFRLIEIVRDADEGFRTVVESRPFYDYFASRVRNATEAMPRASYRELIPDITDYFPTEEDLKLIASTSFRRR